MGWWDNTMEWAGLQDSDLEGRINYILSNYEIPDEAMMLSSDFYDKVNALNRNSDEVKLVFWIVQNDKNTGFEAIKNIARLHIYLAKNGWRYHKTESTREATKRFLESDQDASIVWDQQGVPSVTNWNDIDKYIDSRNWLEDDERLAHYYHWYETFNIPAKKERMEAEKSRKKEKSNDESEESETTDESSDSFIENLINPNVKKAAMPVIAIILIAGVVVTIVYNEKFRK